jgi:hypothetical protein
MSKSSSPRNSTLLAVLLLALTAFVVTAAPAQADEIYSMSDLRPDNLISGGYDAIQASFVVSGTTITSASFSITTPNGTVYSESAPNIIQSGISFSGTHLELGNPGLLVLQSGPVSMNGTPFPPEQAAYMVLAWRNDSTNGNYYQGSTQNIPSQYQTPYFWTDGSSIARDSNTGNWIIASTPEPATLSLLMLVGLTMIRRRA